VHSAYIVNNADRVVDNLMSSRFGRWTLDAWLFAGSCRDTLRFADRRLIHKNSPAVNVTVSVLK